MSFEKSFVKHQDTRDARRRGVLHNMTKIFRVQLVLQRSWALALFLNMQKGNKNIIIPVVVFSMTDTTYLYQAVT